MKAECIRKNVIGDAAKALRGTIEILAVACGGGVTISAFVLFR